MYAMDAVKNIKMSTVSSELHSTAPYHPDYIVLKENLDL